MRARVLLLVAVSAVAVIFIAATTIVSMREDGSESNAAEGYKVSREMDRKMNRGRQEDEEVAGSGGHGKLERLRVARRGLYGLQNLRCQHCPCLFSDDSKCHLCFICPNAAPSPSPTTTGTRSSASPSTSSSSSSSPPYLSSSSSDYSQFVGAPCCSNNTCCYFQF